jgi:hydrogenase expression/formation protein HypE
VTGDTGTRLMRRRDGTEVPLRMPAQDPFWPVFFEGIG